MISKVFLYKLLVITALELRDRFCPERWSRLALVGRVDVLQVLLVEA